jgi:prolipoprotein diacylglyceryltransferase
MKTYTNVLYWTPRISVILAILFISLFALDSFSSERNIWQNIIAFLIHLIPSFILLGLLLIAWKWERTGGILFTIFGLAFGIFIFVINYKRTHSLEISFLLVLELCIPFVLAGILFIVSYYRKKR